jgi:hypothetical protein
MTKLKDATLGEAVASVIPYPESVVGCADKSENVGCAAVNAPDVEV